MKTPSKNFFLVMIGLCLSLSTMSATHRDKRLPMMGWSSWNTYEININEELIKSQADALISSGLNTAGYQYINIDDGYFGGRDDDGNLLAHPTRFPNGMKVVADYIHSLGLRAGIYSDAGINTCASYALGDTIGRGVGLWKHEAKDIDLFFNTWGYDFIKVDFCGVPGINRNNPPTDEERYTSISQTIDAIGRKDVSMNVCRWGFPGVWVKDVAESWRISGDIYLEWKSIVNNISENLYLSAYSGYGRYNDMDMLEIGRGLTQTEEETHFGMWCIMSSPLLIGCDLTTIPPSSLEILTNPELIAINQDPLGLQAYVVQHTHDCYVLVKDIKKLRGKERAVALYNPSDKACSVTVPFSDLELSGKVSIRNATKREDWGTFTESFTAEVPAHGAIILTMKGRNRLEPTHYEAEWASLNCFQLYNSREAAYYVKGQGNAISGKTKVGNLGSYAENYAEWDKVYSNKGGNYQLSIYYMTGENRNLTVIVNGQTYELKSLHSGSWDTPAVHTMDVRLNKGYNTIRMGNPTAWAPDIDCFKLEKK